MILSKVNKKQNSNQKVSNRRRTNIWIRLSLNSRKKSKSLRKELKKREWSCRHRFPMKRRSYKNIIRIKLMKLNKRPNNNLSRIPKRNREFKNKIQEKDSISKT